MHMGTFRGWGASCDVLSGIPWYAVTEIRTKGKTYIHAFLELRSDFASADSTLQGRNPRRFRAVGRRAGRGQRGRFFLGRLEPPERERSGGLPSERGYLSAEAVEGEE